MRQNQIKVSRVRRSEWALRLPSGQSDVCAWDRHANCSSRSYFAAWPMS